MFGHGSPTFCGRGSHRSLCACSWAVHGKITRYGKPKHLNYCDIFIVYTQYIYVAAGRITQPGGPRVGDPCTMLQGYLSNINNLNLPLKFQYLHPTSKFVEKHGIIFYKRYRPVCIKTRLLKIESHAVCTLHKEDVFK